MLYEDVCTVYAQTEELDPETKRTRKTWRAVAEDIPCRLSFSGISAASSGDGADKATQSVKVFTAPDVEIKPGSRLHIVRASGAASDWSMSGVPASYSTHCEYMLSPMEVYV